MERYHDPYGSLTAALVAWSMHRDATRATGRTTMMVRACMDSGGVIICTNATNIEHILKKEGGRAAVISGRIQILSCDPRDPARLFQIIRHGPVYFDHYWLEEYFLNELQRSSHLITEITRRFSSPTHRYKDGPASIYPLAPIGDLYEPSSKV